MKRALWAIVILMGTAFAQSVQIGGGVKIGGAVDNVTGKPIAPSSVSTNSITLPGVTIDQTGYHSTTGLNASTVESGTDRVCVSGGLYCVHFVTAWPDTCSNGHQYNLVVAPYGQQQCQNGTLVGTSTTVPEVPTCQSGHYYVATTGSDSANGDCAHPWATIGKANSTVTAGSTVHVAPGVYTYYPSLTLSASGSAGSPVTWISDTRGGAKILSSGATSDYAVAVIISGSYVNFQGFEVTATNTSKLNMGVDLQGSYVTAKYNTVHDLPAPGPAGIGGCGICSQINGSNGHNTADGNHVYNIGTLNPTTISNRVHGIYFSTPYGTISNNILHHNRDWGVQIGHAATENTIVNNTIFSNGNGGIMISLAGADITAWGLTAPGHDLRIQNNVVYHNGLSPNANGYGIQEYNNPGAGSLTTPNYYTTNLVYDNLPDNWHLQVTGAGNIAAAPSGSISAAPNFRNWQADGSGDYKPAVGGNLVGAGTAANAPAKDYLGVTRPSPPSLGVYE